MATKPDSSSSSSNSKSAEALLQVLKSHTAREVLEMASDSGGGGGSAGAGSAASGKTIIEIDSTMTPVEASKVLWENNILGAPVWDATKQQYLGFFDMRDTLGAILAATKKSSSSEGQDNEQEQEKGKAFEDILTEHLQAQNITVPAMAAQNPFVSCQADTLLEQVCRLMNEHPESHCMPVVGKNSDGDDNNISRVIGIISQSALIKFLVQHVDVKDESSFHKETLQDVENFLPYRKDVISVQDTAPARQVFELLYAKDLSGIAVVDEETGKLVGNTSARDIKLSVLGHAVGSGSGSDVISMDDMDILSYLAAIRQLTFTRKERYPSAHVTETSTVGHALGMLAKTGYHRVFVVDNQVRPVGVVSVTDIIRFAVGGEEK